MKEYYNNYKKKIYPKLNGKFLYIFGDWLNVLIIIINNNKSIIEKNLNIISNLLINYLFNKINVVKNISVNMKKGIVSISAIYYKNRNPLIKLFIHIDFRTNLLLNKIDSDILKYKKGSKEIYKVMEAHVFFYDKTGHYITKLGYNTDLFSIRKKILNHIYNN